MEITGKIIKVMPLKKGVSQASGKEWMCQDFVLEVPNEYNPQYPERLVLNVFGAEKINEIALKEDKEIKVAFSFNAKEYKGAWFNTLSVWRAESVNAQDETPQTQTEAPQASAPKVETISPSSSMADDESSLPF